MSEVCIITGVGPGTGSALVRRFAAEGYKIAMIARDKQRLIGIQSTVEGARSYPCDVSDENALTTTLNQILVEMGPPRIVIHNAVTAARGDYLSVDTDAMNTAWQVNVMALLTLSRWATPLMVERDGGVILCTGNTAAYRGKAHFAGFAPTKAAQRILSQPQPREVNMDRNPKRSAREMVDSIEETIEQVAKKRTGMGIRDLEIRRPRA